MNRSPVLVALIAALGLAACTSTPTNDSTPTSPAGTPVAVVTEVVTHTVTNPPKAPPASGKTMIDSFGFGSLKLGMTREQAIATKLIGPDKGIQARYCTAHDILGTGQSLTISDTRGISSITFSKDLQPQGAGVGGTRQNVIAAHPNLKAEPNAPGWHRAEASNNPDAYFSYYIAVDGNVRSANLIRNEQDCVG
jgi:hypothetical protein